MGEGKGGGQWKIVYYQAASSDIIFTACGSLKCALEKMDAFRGV